MPELLEDPDGAPYPDPVQQFYNDWQQLFGGQALEEFREQLVAALESVAKHDDDEGPLTTKQKLDAIETSGLQIAYDGCHKLYLIEKPSEYDDAIANGYTAADFHPASEVRSLIKRSCFLVFIHPWSLDHDHPWDLGQETEDIQEA